MSTYPRSITLAIGGCWVVEMVPHGLRFSRYVDGLEQTFSTTHTSGLGDAFRWQDEELERYREEAEAEFFGNSE